MVRDTLHRLGLGWGGMDCFQWRDPIHQADHLIWAEVDDGDLGYALPERIAAGQQHFRAIRFILDIPRSPAPAHVLEQMLRLGAACQQLLPGCRLDAILDGRHVDGPDALRAGVASVVDALTAHGLKPGASDVLQLR